MHIPYFGFTYRSGRKCRQPLQPAPQCSLSGPAWTVAAMSLPSERGAAADCCWSVSAPALQGNWSLVLAATTGRTCTKHLTPTPHQAGQLILQYNTHSAEAPSIGAPKRILCTIYKTFPHLLILLCFPQKINELRLDNCCESDRYLMLRNSLFLFCSARYLFSLTANKGPRLVDSHCVVGAAGGD